MEIDERKEIKEIQRKKIKMDHWSDFITVSEGGPR
jgi:hypothetical protein